MECKIYDQTLTRIGILAGYQSLVWREQYCDTGALQLVVNKTDWMLDKLQDGNFIGLRGQDTLMVIKSHEDKDGQIWAYGSESKTVLADRIYDGTINAANVESTLRTAVMAKRPQPVLDLAPLRGLSATSGAQRTYPDLYTLSKTLCSAAGYGFRLVHDVAAKKLLYDVYCGVERTGVKFSGRYGNLTNFTRKMSSNGYKNVAYVAGGDEGSDRVVVVVGDTAAEGFARREMFVDARDLQQEDLTLTEYQALLTARGEEKLAETVPIDEIKFDINPVGFGTSFGLGDTIICVLPEYNAKLSTRITGFTRTLEENTDKLSLIIGTPVLRSVI